ncbi:myosin-3 isoform X2 [Orussus abietinus]|uniref:myosin-3 isoform X2 n=1 Tax=Orussus abietinus TaxID=222816 RepID=UPI00062554C0|nr:myosin-3 isoform X2 [Orussus abietinus]
MAAESGTLHSGDSRIPRPSPTPLRRSFSARMRGERDPEAPTAPLRGFSSALSRSRQRHELGLEYRIRVLERPQDRAQDLPRGTLGPSPRLQERDRLHQRSEFPVITENGADSPRHRSLSLSLTTPPRPRPGHGAARTAATTPATATDESDVESVKSYGSACSTASACDHAHFALNGTTWSGRSRKYVVHCSNKPDDNEQYLTPTQRAARQLRKFQTLLRDAKKEIEDKDREIFRLTKEVVELRLYKASLNSPDERTDSSDAVTVRENDPFSPESPTKNLPNEGSFETSRSPEASERRAPLDFPSSSADSGHYEDGSVHSKDSLQVVDVPSAISGNDVVSDRERCRLVDHYESRIEEMHRRHVDELQDLKQKHNDKVENLLQQISELNTRCCDLRPSLDEAEKRNRELSAELETIKLELDERKALLDEQEERNKCMYLKMYAKGQEAARLEQAEQMVQNARQPQQKVSVAELLQQLTVTQAELDNVKAMYRRVVEAKSNQGALDPEITLQFLKSAIYYFLTDKENHHGHLNAIESILGFTDTEKLNIDKIYRSARK